ncbi:MAG TPA: cytochrome b/b6 domain-containing protein [Vicinamibacterales bacterium]|nr:cytochrome b/b6 domain-containing protein [Vicinamibacterales bacterium]
MTRYVQRFSRWQRLQHFCVMVLFTLLCFTGLPQKFYESGWAASVLDFFGGIDRARWIHRACGLSFAGLMVIHFAVEISRLIQGRGSLSLVPNRQDFRDAVVTLRYYLGMSDQQARFDRFDYRQKFEYWGLVLGSVLVVSTGLVLLFPVEVTQWLPGTLVPVAMVAHSNEGLLAFLTILIWHIYNAHLNPDVFPFDTTIFTGRISLERMHHEHPRELERMGTSAEEKHVA